MDDIAYEDMEYVEFAEHYANGNLSDARQLYTSNPEDLKYSNNISIHSDQYILLMGTAQAKVAKESPYH